MMLKNVTEGIQPGQMLVYASVQQTGKSYYRQLYDKNLCQEIMLTGKKNMMSLLTSLNIPGYPKTTSSLHRLMPKYQFSRSNWYVAEFDWEQQDEVLEWCTNQFGPHPIRPDAWSRWCNKYSEKIHFRDAKDYEWFMLRWS